MPTPLSQTYHLCSSRFLFVRRGEGDDAAVTAGCVSFTTEYGAFAALGHGEGDGKATYADSEVYACPAPGEDPVGVGVVLRSEESGLYGAFCDEPPETFASMSIAPLDSLRAGAPAELWMPPEGSVKPRVYRGKIAALFPDKPFPVLFEADDPKFPGASWGSSGSVVVQDKKIAAVVAGANETPGSLLYCTAAETMAEAMWKMVVDACEGEEE